MTESILPAPLERAGPAHALLLALVHEAAFPPDQRWSVAVIAGHLGMPGVYGIFHPAGGMVLGRVAADEAEILTLGVAPQARRRGAGAMLVSGAASFACAAGAATMFLEVSTRNSAARALYERAGFTEAGRRARYYPDGSDALVLSLSLRRGMG